MQKITSFTFLLFLHSCLIAQSFSPFPGNWDYSYLVPDSSLHVVRVDSIDSLGSDVHFHFNPVIRTDTGTYLDCWGSTVYEPYDLGHNVFGSEMIAKPGGTFLFAGPSGDTLKLETSLSIGIKWEFSPLSGDSAWIDTVYAATVLDSADSLMEIKTTSGKTFTISQNFGFQSGPVFWPLERFLMDCMGKDSLHELSLLGIKNLNAGQFFPGFTEIYAFDTGDQYSVEQETFWYGFPGESGTGYQYDFEIQSKTVSADQDTISYGVLQDVTPYSYDPIYGMSTGTTTRGSATRQYLKADYAKGDHLPQSHPDKGMMNYYLCHSRIRADFYNRISAEFQLIPSYFDTCASKWSFACTGLYNESYTYAAGVGLINFWGGDSDGGNSEQTLCYKKGPEVWPTGGSCLILNKDEEMFLSDEWKIYPNPAQSYFLLETGTLIGRNVQLKLIDMQGKEVRNLTFMPDAAGISPRIETANLSPGLYLIQLGVQGQNPQSYRLLKE